MQESTAASKIASRDDNRRVSTGKQLGHIHLRAADVDQALEFYRNVIGLDAIASGSAVRLQAGFPAGDAAPLLMQIGAYHFVILYPDLAALTAAVRRLAEHDYPIDSEPNDVGTVSVHLRDPDGNGIELRCEQPDRVLRTSSETRVVRVTWIAG
jgi:catechol 2,3-dioxygenase